MRRVCIIAAVAVIVSVFGCASQHTDGNNHIPAVGSSIDKANSHVQSAESANQRIKPHADKTGQELVNVVHDEHTQAEKELSNAKQELNQARNERDILQRAVQIQTARADKAEATWGYRAEVWIKRFTALLITLVAVHYLAGGLAVVLPLFFPASAVAVPILKTVGAICNPAAWAQFAYDHIHLSRCVGSKPTITITQGG